MGTGRALSGRRRKDCQKRPFFTAVVLVCRDAFTVRFLFPWIFVVVVHCLALIKFNAPLKSCTIVSHPFFGDLREREK